MPHRRLRVVLKHCRSAAGTPSLGPTTQDTVSFREESDPSHGERMLVLQ
jgi:hypothetical protein